jgi:hypothetical protein
VAATELIVDNFHAVTRGNKYELQPLRCFPRHTVRRRGGVRRWIEQSPRHAVAREGGLLDGNYGGEAALSLASPPQLPGRSTAFCVAHKHDGLKLSRTQRHYR